MSATGCGLGIVGAPGFEREAEMLSALLAIPLGEADATLHVETTWWLQLKQGDETLKLSADFAHGQLDWRRKHSSGKAEPVVKAVWGRANTPPSVFDATGGRARDSFLLAASGCAVRAMEQHPLIAALIDKALQDAALSDEPALQSVLQHLHYQHGNSAEFLSQQTQGFVDVIYLDPMFPPRPGAAKVKKDMQVLQALTETGLGDELLPLARAKAGQKVIVKRPSYAPPLANTKPSAQLPAGLNRFDIYPIQR